MTELSPESKALLEAGNAGLAPAAEAKARVLAAVEANVSAGGITVATGFTGLKLIAVVLVAAGVGGGLWLSRDSEEVAVATPAINTPAIDTPKETTAKPPIKATSSIATDVVQAEAAPIIRKMKREKKSNLLAEQKLIAAAQVAIRKREYARAQSLLATHKRQFPRGILSPERNAATAIAHCESGKSGVAIANRFLRTHADSPLAARVRASCRLDK